MLELFQSVFLLLVALVAWTYIRVAKGISYPGDVPRFGEPGVWGYLTTAFRYTFDAESVISEGRAKYSGQPFAVPTLVSSFVLSPGPEYPMTPPKSGPVFLLGPQYYEIVRSSTDDNVCTSVLLT